MSPGKTKTQLSILYFFQYCILGGVVPVLSLYLKELPGFNGTMTGVVISMTSIASIASPLIAQRVADRYIPAEKLFSVLHISCAVLIIIFRQQTNFAAVTAVYLFLMLTLSPTSPLLNILVFHALGKEKTKYGFLRVWGTFGWIFMAVFFSYIWLGSGIIPFERHIGDVYYLTAFFCLVQGFYALSITSGKTDKSKIVKAEKFTFNNLPSGARRKELLFFAVVSILASIADKSYFLGIAPYLKFSGFPENSIMPSISIGMIPEVAAMFILYRFINRFGYKIILSAGIFAHILRALLFIAASETGAFYLILPGIFLHGFTFAFFVSVSYIFLDTFCIDTTRSSVHLIYAFLVSGTGNLVGNLIGGILLDFSLSVRGSYTLFWIFPLLMSVTAFVLLRRYIYSK